MTAIVTAFYNHDGRLMDSVKLSDIEVMALKRHVANHARVRDNENNVSVHFLPTSAHKAEEIVAQYVQVDVKAKMCVLEAWFTAAGAIGGRDYIIEPVNGRYVKLQTYTIGGMLDLPAFDVSEQKAMTDAKTWILSKKGTFQSQQNDGTVIFELHVKKAGLNFLGYLTALDELGDWPTAAQAEGNAWLTPDAVILFAEGQMLQYSRYEANVAIALTALVEKMGDKKTPAPVNRDDPRLDKRFTLAEFEENYPDRATGTLISTVKALVNNYSGNPVELSCTTDLGHISTVLWIDDQGYPLASDYVRTGSSGLTSGQMMDIDHLFNLKADLAIADIPADLFDVQYTFDMDWALKFYTPGGHRAVAIVSPSTVVFIDSINVTEVSRISEEDADRASVIAHVYGLLLKNYPQRASSIVDIMVEKLREGGQTVQVSSEGPLAESVAINHLDGATVVKTRHFHITDLLGIAQYMLDGDDDSLTDDAEVPEPSQLADEPLQPSARGQLKHSVTVDELPTLPEDTSGHEKPVSTGLEEIAAGMKTLHALRSKRNAAPAESGPASEYDAESAIVIPVQSQTGEPMYRAVFIFANPTDKGMALDIGFGAQIASKLGMDGYKGYLVAGTRIGDLPTIAEHVRKHTLPQVSGPVRYYRES